MVCHHIALITAEFAPLASTGGLGDMVSGLATTLHQSGVSTRVVFPRYACVPRFSAPSWSHHGRVRLGSQILDFYAEEGVGPHGGPLLLIDIPTLFDRPGLYGDVQGEYRDNGPRFLAFGRAALAALMARGAPIDAIHLHDWHAAPIAAWLRTTPQAYAPLQSARTLLTIHNLGYQGLCPARDFGLLELPPAYFTPRCFEFYGQLNLLKAGILCADALSTVSPNYAREILTPEFGCGLDGVLRTRAADLVGITNGIDTAAWDPTSSAHLPAHFSGTDLQGKAACKAALQKEFGLPPSPEVPLFCVVGRMAHQKGTDLLLEAIAGSNGTPQQWILLGRGDRAFEARAQALALARPERVHVQLDFQIRLAHQITAGSDFTCMPSRFEPCGLQQLYGQRYGTIPVARAVGGLRDTVRDLETAQATGVLYGGPTVADLRGALHRALEIYRRPAAWAALQRAAMAQDFSWSEAVLSYRRWYARVLAAPPHRFSGRI
ncbi:MAG: glycogen synthase GlgA [Deltaproteobacteria bacterium]|nr:glycogen synthase GlgA [Deltaproteobacteria bacterium]